ncbi:thermonuclease family protein [Balneatrix alpica]|uniref:Thermonuclease family protein n=1 Tax=Balneatrix alpica TaxID=75684 RepID=A0ABV5ZAM3_9GAMM|nr:thermonuclease family protein [Balneatrix alpica]
MQFALPWLRLGLFALCLLPLLVRADYGDVLVSEISSIYDGDTFRVSIHNWPSVVGERIPVRIRGIDTPELRGQCEEEKRQARAAKQFTVAALRQAREIKLKKIERDKYFRLLAEVYVDGRNLGEELVRQGLARRYDGGSKAGWCRS